MYLYHGTTLEKALDILQNRVVKGKKTSRKQSNRYVSFTENLLEARKFGEVVFQFQHVEQAMLVQYQEQQWTSHHSEIVDYLVEREEVTVEGKEYVLFNKHRFADQNVTVYLIGEHMKDLNQLKKQLDVGLNVGDVVKKSVKLYEEFLNS